MFYSRVSLSEGHPDYPFVWQSDCGTHRVIRCVDDLQWIVQKYRRPKWRSLSYHREWSSIRRRWGSVELFITLP